MKIIVLTKQVPDTWGARTLSPVTNRLERSASDAVVDDIDERALELALQYQDDHGAEVVAISMGPAGAEDVLRKALAMGADSAVHVLDESLVGSDAVWTARVLAAAITASGFDLVIAGNESTDGRGGVVPALIAEELGVPSIGYLDSAEITEHAVSGVRGTEYGTLAVHATLPAVISVTERTPEPRFANFRGIMKAKKKPLDVVTAASLGVNGLQRGGQSIVLSVTERPARAAGEIIIDEGDAGRQLADYLVANRLI